METTIRRGKGSKRFTGGCVAPNAVSHTLQGGGGHTVAPDHPETTGLTTMGSPPKSSSVHPTREWVGGANAGSTRGKRRLLLCDVRDGTHEKQGESGTAPLPNTGYQHPPSLRSNLTSPEFLPVSLPKGRLHGPSLRRYLLQSWLSDVGPLGTSLRRSVAPPRAAR
ncbi:unnamed protein product [Lota lota]